MSSQPQVVILTAGLATGLRPLSLERPKVLAPVCNETLLRRLLKQLIVAGIQEASLVVRLCPRDINETLIGEAPPGFKLTVSVLPEAIDGTVPAVRHAIEGSNSSVLVIYGDSLMSVDFTSLLNFHDSACAPGGLATILFHQPTDLRLPRPGGRTYHGVMSVTEQGLTTRFKEKPYVTEIIPGFDLANAAVFICEGRLFEDPFFRNAKDFSIDVFERLATEETQTIYGCSIGRGFRCDIGNIARFFSANMQVLSRELQSQVLRSVLEFG